MIDQFARRGCLTDVDVGLPRRSGRRHLWPVSLPLPLGKSGHSFLDLCVDRRAYEVQTILVILDQSIDPCGRAFHQRQLDAFVELFRSAHGEGVHGGARVVNGISCIG